MEFPTPQTPQPATAGDESLMVRIQERDPEALAELYDRYSGILKSLIMGVIHNDAEADDLLQEIFMEIWNQAAHYSAQKGKPLGWIVTLTRRRSIDRLRKKQAYARAEERLQNETEQQPDAWVHNSTENDIEMSDTRRLILGVLRNLPVAQREAIDLAFYHGMSQREIAAKTGIPLGTIKTRLELGLKKVSEALRGMKDEF
jgi:RNA polymerase sigma-70 factor (ECF subfamily)